MGVYFSVELFEISGSGFWGQLGLFSRRFRFGDRRLRSSSLPFYFEWSNEWWEGYALSQQREFMRKPRRD